MRNVLRYLVGRTYKPLLEKRLSRTRFYRHQNIRVQVPPEVFHPGYFFSTRLLLKQLAGLSLAGKTFLEPGAGSGLLSVYAAKRGATVTATDINPVAVDAVRGNALRNGVQLSAIESNLFESIPPQRFDVVVINPPYYKKKPVAMKDYAWFCGENGEFFQGLFEGLNRYVHEGSVVLMILCDGCDLGLIHRFANEASVRFDCVATHENWLEKNFIYRIRFNERTMRADSGFPVFGNEDSAEVNVR